MSPLESLLNALKTGAKEEKIRAITELAKLKDPRAMDALRGIMKSDGDGELSLMAAMALALSGDTEAIEAMAPLYGTDKPDTKEMFSFVRSLSADGEFFKDFNLSSLIEEFEAAQRLINQSLPDEAREKLLKLLHVYNKCRKTDASAQIDGFFNLMGMRTEGLILTSLAQAEQQLGNLDKSIEYCNKALVIGKEIEDGQILGIAFGSLGVAYAEMDKYYQALDCYQKSLDAMDKYFDPWKKKNRVLSNMSYLYYMIGDADKSVEFAKEALNAARVEKDLWGLCRCMNAAGVGLLGENDELAGSYFVDAIEYAEESGDRQTQATALSNLGFLYFVRKEYDKAVDYLRRAQAVFEDTGNKVSEASIWVNLAHLHMEKAEMDNAKDCAEKARGLAMETTGLRDDANACYILGALYHYHYNDSETAYDYYDEAINAFETIRQGIGVDDLKISFAENSVSAYAQMVTLCLEHGKTAKAFEFVERSKSRALVELLSKAIEEINPHAVSSEKAQEFLELKRRLDFLKNWLKRLYGKVEYFNDETGKVRMFEEKETLFTEIAGVEARYKELYEDIRMCDPEFVSFSNIEPLKIDELKELLNEDTKLIEYYQTDGLLYIFIIEKNKEISSFTVEVDVNKELEELRNLLENLGDTAVSNTASHDFIKNIEAPLSRFYELLILPVEDAIKDAKRLIIVPHVFWHHLPFHALMDEKRKEYLVDRFEIVHLPSADVLKYCRKKGNSLPKSAVIFANPTGDLPYAEEEARRIAAYFEPNVKIFKREDATFENLSAANGADVIHFACHAVFRADEPIFSHLVLADVEGSKGTCLLPDIFNLKFGNSAIVSLSACESGLSRIYTGDDLVGFARGFFYAGAMSVLATLWRVNDKSTSLLMDEFYRGLIKENLPKSKALQLAILKIKSAKEYQHPYFWAPFILLGDWA